MSRTAPAAEHLTVGVRLILGAIALGMLARPAILFWAEHIDERFAEEPMGTVSQLSVVLPVVLVPLAVVAALIANSWQRSEQAVLVLMVPALTFHMWLAPAGFACSAVGGIAEPCGLDPVSSTREFAVNVISLGVVAALTWLGTRPSRQTPMRRG